MDTLLYVQRIGLLQEMPAQGVRLVQITRKDSLWMLIQRVKTYILQCGNLHAQIRNSVFASPTLAETDRTWHLQVPGQEKRQSALAKVLHKPVPVVLTRARSEQ